MYSSKFQTADINVSEREALHLQAKDLQRSSGLY